VKLIYEKSVPGRRGTALPVSDVPAAPLPAASLLRSAPAGLPETSELDAVRHFTNLSRRNYSVDSVFYPLGSCTMKYNPKAVEAAAAREGFAGLHPFLGRVPGGAERVQGALRLLCELQSALCDLTGMAGFSLQPLAGAQGELAGMLMVRARHEAAGEPRKTVLVPDAAHGTNPASAAMAGYEVVSIPTGPDGQMDISAYRRKLTEEVAAVVLTCPNTLGIFNRQIGEICESARAVGALVYYDGANLNAVMGKIKPGEVGFDIVHLNLHKTFAAPHGGGGPGAGPVGARAELVEFLPGPVVVKKPGGEYGLSGPGEKSIGLLAPFYGNFSVLVKAYAYILLLGMDGLASASEKAVLNANYVLAKLKGDYDLPYARVCMHECVFSAARQAAGGIHALDIAKFLIDAGFHPPTVYFPLIVKEAMMIEPTETESKETLDEFVAAMTEAARLAREDPEKLKSAPVSSPVGRLDETRAARELNLKFPEA